MANNSVADFLSFINQQIKSHEQIEACLWRLEALIMISVMAKEFFRLPESTLHSYFLVVGDLIEEVARANQLSLDNLLKIKLLNDYNDYNA